MSELRFLGWDFDQWRAAILKARQDHIRIRDTVPKVPRDPVADGYAELMTNGELMSAKEALRVRAHLLRLNIIDPCNPPDPRVRHA